MFVRKKLQEWINEKQQVRGQGLEMFLDYYLKNKLTPTRKLILFPKCTSISLRDKYEKMIAFPLIRYSQMHEFFAADICHPIDLKTSEFAILCFGSANTD